MLAATASVGDTAVQLEEEALVHRLSREDLRRLHGLRLESIRIRRRVAPLRGILDTLLWPEEGLTVDETRAYLQNVLAHCRRALAEIASGQAMLTSLQDLVISESNQRMSDVIDRLTLISTIFIPLTFLAGIYEMNFQHTPELAWRWSHPTLLLVMVVIAGGLLLLFRRNGWLGRPQQE